MKIAKFQPIDMISNLPDNVIESILMCLAIRDGAKTSVLSRQWRYKWVKLPLLIFDDTLWQESERNRELARMKFVEILYQVLLRHEGSITKSSLIIPGLIGGSEIDHLIYILWKKGVEEFTLKMTIAEVYKLPSSLFMCSQLEHLNLSSCLISPPPSFKGFNRLITLKLLDVFIDTEVLGGLISSSPKLEQLVLHVPAGFHHLKIYAPKLKLVGLKCYRAYVYFKNCPRLAVVSIASMTTCIYDNEEIKKDRGCNFIWFFDYLPALQQLRIDYNMMKLERISGTVSEMTLIKLLLEKSPKLDTMVIRLKRPSEKPLGKLADKGFGISAETNKFKRASPNAKVIFKALDENEIW